MKRTEAELVRYRNHKRQRSYRRTRRRAMTFFIASVLIAAATLSQGFDFASAIAISVILISALLYFDANGHLRELRLRTEKTLVPDFSLLQKDSTDKSPSGKAGVNSSSETST